MSTTYMPSAPPLAIVDPASDEPVAPDVPEVPLLAGAAAGVASAGGVDAAGVTVDVSLGAVVTGADVSGIGGAVGTSSFLQAASKGIQASAMSNVFISASIFWMEMPPDGARRADSGDCFLSS